MATIAVIGSLNMDLVAQVPRTPRAGETLMGSRYLTAHGGKGANQAYAAAKLGGDVAMLGRVGSDDYGKWMCANLAATGCDVSRIRAVPGSSGVAMIFVEESGQNCIAVIPGANQEYRPADVLIDLASLPGARYALMQLETPIDTVMAASRAARYRGAQVILDPAPAPAELPAELLSHVDILTPNETEATALIGAPATRLTFDEARDIAFRLREIGARTVIIKLGAQGCLVLDGNLFTEIAAPSVEVVDTTAAGDVFNAALTVASSEGATILEACRFAVQVSSVSVTRLGAQPSVPSRSEIATLVGSWSCRFSSDGTEPDSSNSAGVRLEGRV